LYARSGISAQRADMLRWLRHSCHWASSRVYKETIMQLAEDAVSRRFLSVMKEEKSE